MVNGSGFEGKYKVNRMRAMARLIYYFEFKYFASFLIIVCLLIDSKTVVIKRSLKTISH